MTPIFGINITPKAIIVMDAESIGCNTFSVDQNSNNNMDITIKRHSRALTGPSLCNSSFIKSLPPSIVLISGGITLIMMKYKAMDITMDQGAAYKNHSPHETSNPN